MVPLDINELPPRPKPPLKMAIGINLAIMLVYIIAINPDPYLAGKAVCIVAQVILNLVLGIIFLFFEKRKATGQALLLSALVVLLVGFGACLARGQF